MPTTSSPSPAPTPPRMPLAVRIALGQLALAVVAFATVPALALKKSHSPSPASPATATDTGPSADASASLVSNDPAARGAELFGQFCAACHQPSGAGIPGAFPPLAGSDYLLASPERAVGIVLHGLSGPVTVNGVAYESAMPPMPMDDADVASVLTYVLQAWGNRGPAVTAETVARIRADGPKS